MVFSGSPAITYTQSNLLFQLNNWSTAWHNFSLEHTTGGKLRRNRCNWCTLTSGGGKNVYFSSRSNLFQHIRNEHLKDPNKTEYCTPYRKSRNWESYDLELPRET